MNDLIFKASVLVSLISFGYLLFLYHKRLFKVEEICEKKRNAIEILDSIAKNLTDPIKIEAEMEATATAREMRDAGRKYLPRENAGPSAKVHRPPTLRSVPRKR